LEPLVSGGGGLILDWHTCDAFPEWWIDLVVVLQCNHTQLWDRLEAQYSSTSSFGGFDLFEEGCTEDDMTQDDKVDEKCDA
jgi:hypothetical protein